MSSAPGNSPDTNSQEGRRNFSEWVADRYASRAEFTDEHPIRGALGYIAGRGVELVAATSVVALIGYSSVPFAEGIREASVEAWQRGSKVVAGVFDGFREDDPAPNTPNTPTPSPTALPNSLRIGEGTPAAEQTEAGTPANNTTPNESVSPEADGIDGIPAPGQEI